MTNLNDDILSNIDIVDVVSKYVELKKTGRNFTGLCPFHREKTPSFSVAQDKQIFKCFGCGIGGNAIKFVMEIEKLEYWDTIKLLSKDAGVDLSKYKFDNNKQEVLNEREKFKLINKKAQEFFLSSFDSNNNIKEYVYNNRKLNKHLVKLFGIGYAPDSHYDLISFLKKKGFSDQDLISSGIAKKGSSGDLYSFFRNRLMFPIYDHMGTLVAFAGRSINANDMPKYLNTAESILYDKSKILYGLHNVKSSIKDYNKLIILEGYMDVIGLSKAGVDIGLATCGTSLTTQHLKHIKRFTDNVVLGFDNDEAGFEATIRALKLCYQYDIYPLIIKLTEKFKDIDEYVNYLFETNRELLLKDFFQGKKVDLDIQEIDGLKYILDTYSEKHNLSSPIERKRFMNDLFDLIINIKDISVQMFFIEEMGSKIKSSFNILRNQFVIFSKNKNKFIKKAINNNDTKLSDKYLLGAFFYSDFINDNGLDGTKIDDLLSFIKEIYLYLKDGFLLKIFNNDIDLLDKSNLLQAQMIWEKNLENQSIEKKIDYISRYLFEQIKTILQLLNKSSIGNQDKIQINQKYQKILKNHLK